MGEVLSAIAQYGICPVIASAVVYLLIFLHTKMADRKRAAQEAADKRALIQLENDKEAERQRLEAEKEARFMAMVKEIVVQTINPTHTVEEQKESREHNQFIAHQLDCLVNEGADRAYVFSFHNGGKDVLGHGFLKMSMTQESIGANVAPIMALYQSMPRMLFPKLYDQLEKYDYYNIDDVEALSLADPQTYQFLIQHGATIAMFRSIKNEAGMMIGFVGMEYIYKTCEDKHKAGKNIDKKTNRIMGALLGQSGQGGQNE